MHVHVYAHVWFPVLEGRRDGSEQGESEKRGWVSAGKMCPGEGRV